MATPGCFAWASRPIGWAWPTNTTRSSRCRSPASIRCPHQLEAVYGYFMRLPRIRFLLADDPGAGKTIMAGLLLKELKARGLVRRVLIVTPANLTFQWQREMADKFREKFEVIRGDVLRANYGQNPWQERDQVVTSVSWVSLVEDARESLLRSRWDLVIVDEAHKMSARSEDHKTYAYRLGESLSKMTDHYLLMTATPHKGDPDHFRRFLALLDADVYGSIQSLEQAMRDHEAPFYLRRTKEALVTFPDPDTGEVRKLFTKREVRTRGLRSRRRRTRFLRRADPLRRRSIDHGRGRRFRPWPGGRLHDGHAPAPHGFVDLCRPPQPGADARPPARRSWTTPKPIARNKSSAACPTISTISTEEEQQQIIGQLEAEVLSADPAVLREEIARLSRARSIWPASSKPATSKPSSVKLRAVLNEEGIFDDPKMKLLVFTEHKDTLDYLAGDGKDGRPLGKLREWGLTLTQIHGGMKIGDRDTPGTPHLCRARVQGERPRCSSPPRPPAKASTCSSAG